MLVRPEDVGAVTGGADTPLGPFRRKMLSEVAGLTRFGAYLETLEPGSASSERHWHTDEDEFLFLLEGEAVLVENDGDHPMRPGDAAIWKAGVANGHRVENRSDRPCSYLIVGTRAESDRCHYPDLGHTQINEGRDWKAIEDATGRVLRSGVRD